MISSSTIDYPPGLMRFLPTFLQRPWPLFVLELAVFVLIYHFVSTFNVAFNSISGNVAYIWVAAGISYAVIFLRGYRFWVGVWLGEITEIFFLEIPEVHQIIVGGGNALGLVVGVWLTKYFMRNSHIFYHPSHVVSFLLFGAVLSSVISASVGTASLFLNRAEQVVDPNWLASWWPWCMSNIVAILVIAPVLLGCFQHNQSGFYRPRRFELLLVLTSGGLVTWWIFGNAVGDEIRSYPVTFCFMPFVFWTAFRFSQRETNFVIFALSAGALVGTQMGQGPFALMGEAATNTDNVNEATPALLLQSFIAVISITSFFLLCVISERKRLEDRLEDTVNRRTTQLNKTSRQYRDIFENALEGIYQISPEGRLLKANPSMARILGFDDPDAAVKQIQNVNNMYLEPEQRDEFFRLLTANGFVTGHESEIVTHKGDTLWVVENGRAVKNEINDALRYYEGSMFNITRRKQAEAQLFDMAHHDLLTGLANRRLFYQVLTQAVKRAGRTGKTGALMYFDLDEFKRVNDTLGHEFGDELLKETASRIKSCVRDIDLVSRIGGDEFTLVAENVMREDDAEKLAESIINTLSEPFIWQDQESHIGVSIGITFFDGLHNDIDRLIKEADDAMYRAKRSGKSTFRFYRPL